MEQWEKDYIDAVTESRRTKAQRKNIDCSFEEGYDSSRWVEMSRPDGTKYYVPKENASTSQRKRRQKTAALNIRWMCRQLITVSLGAVLLVCFLLNSRGIPNNPLEQFSAGKHVSLQGFLQGRILGGTYVNGYGFADMMHFFREMQKERQAFLEDIAKNINQLSKMDVQRWSQILEDRETQLEKLKYANSYQEYVNAQKQVFAQQKELLTLIKGPVEIHAVLDLFHQLAEADKSLIGEATEALDKNGIEYSLTESGLTFWYKNY